MLAARPAKRRSVSDSDVIVACTAFYTASQLVSICMRCVYFATIGQSFDWREPIGLQERLEGRSSHNGEFSMMSRSRSQGTEVTIVTGDGFFDSGLQVICIVGSGVSHLPIPLYGVQVKRRESKTLNKREVPETFFYK